MLRLRYIVCVCALIRPKIRNKILAYCIFIQLRLDQQGTKLCWRTYKTQPLTILVAFVLNQLVYISATDRETPRI